MREIIIDESTLTTADELHDQLARELGFPSYYGRNLAALNDCLGDIVQPTRFVVKRDIEGPCCGCASDPDDWFERALRVITRCADECDELDVIIYYDDLQDEHVLDGFVMSADEALNQLKRGNDAYLLAHTNTGDISTGQRRRLFDEGQKPFATIITCSDSRVVPEHLFMTGLGDLFVIRVAGNVVGDMELASAVYAAAHLGSKLIVVLGHTHCGAIESAMHGHAEGALAPLVGAIGEVIGDERDPYAASVLNVRAGISALLSNEEIADLTSEGDTLVVGAVYHTHTGVVDFLE